jgi:membrane protein involved in colicin uptake
MFDIAAATANASGVNAGGRRAPQLSKSAGSATKARGSGSRLQGNLAGALRQQIKNCWYEPADLSNPQRLIVEIAIELSPDGNLARPPRLVTPASRSGADSTLLIAIDNAIRAARQCAPYDLPSDRYDEWQSFNFRFDPREMRRLP